MKNRIFIVFTLLLLNLLFTDRSVAQDNDDKGFYLFGSEEVLEVSLKFDITTYMKKKPAEEYMDAEIVYRIGPQDSLVNKIRLRSRGHSRNEICILPPIRLNFKDCENRPLDIKGVSNVKLVTHCKDNKNFEDYLLSEYLVYKLYNVVTDTSFRVRLLKIRYIDTGSKGFNYYRCGIVIEPIDVLAARLNANEKEDVIVRTRYINHENYDKLCLFQYMIGNDDWHLANLHNLKLIEPEEGDNSVLAVVPYDFDYSGLVNSYYAIPNKLYALENILDRVYIGPCRTDEDIRRVMQFFMDHKSEFYDEIEKIDLLNEKAKKKILNYIDSFYDEYRRDRLFYNIKGTCVKL